MYHRTHQPGKPQAGAVAPEAWTKRGPGLAALLLIGALPGCATQQASGEARPGGDAPTPAAVACRPEGLEKFVGQTASAASGAQMLAASGARTLRWAGPGMAVTMDYRPDRLTVVYDREMRITRLSCG